VGTYAALTGAVTLSASNGNYAKSFDTTNSPQLAITQAALAGTIANQSKTYGAADPALPGIAVALAGLVNNPVIVTWNGPVAVNDTGNVTATLASLTRVAGETVAAPGPTYAITGGTLNPLAGPAAGNYTASLSTAGNTLTINPAALSIRADDTSRPEAMPNPAFTATYNGLQFADTPASLAGALSFSTPAVITSPAGSYPITPFGQSSTNYAITYVNGTLVVGSGTIVPPQIPTAVLDQLTNPLIASFQQLGIGGATWNVAECSGGIGFVPLTSASAWAEAVCANRDEEPVRPIVARAAAPKRVPEMVAAPLADTPASARRAEPRTTETPTAMAASPTPRPVLKYNDVMTAVMYRDQAAVVELLDLGWWVDRPNSNGLTPLMAAALNGDAAITDLLLQRGADPNRRAPGGSVLDYAARGGDGKVIELLRRAGTR